MTRRFQGWVAVVCLALAGTSGPASAQAAFDGTWRVLVVTEDGVCNGDYGFAVSIMNGTLTYVGHAGIDLSGRVSSKGNVNVTIGRGEGTVRGYGRLTRTAGFGTWTGSSGGQQCSGYWEAERYG